MNFSEKTKIGIAGIGYLGGALKYWFDSQGFQALLYDKYKEIGSIEELNLADVIFICLPTPFLKDQDKGFDDSAILEVLGQINGEKIIVIRSTVVPGSTEKYQSQFPQHKFLMNPEFLVAKSAIQDFINSKRQIIGYTEKSKDVAEDILKLLPKADFEKIVRSTEAEMIKYFGNTFLATRLIFANQMYDICQKVGADYEVVKECAGEDPRIGKSHLDVLYDGYRGYGGACLPKDTKAMVQFSKKIGAHSYLLETVDKINEGLVNGKSNI